MKRWGCAALICLLWVGVAHATESTEVNGPPRETPDGLVRVDGTPFELAYVRPGADFSRYRRIQVRPIAIEYAKTPDLTRLVQKRQRNYRITDEQRTRVSRAFAASFTQAMTADGRWVLTTEPGPETLMVRVALANLAVHVPVAKTDSRKPMLVEDAVDVTLVVELRDSLSQQPLARGRDTQSARLASGTFRPDQQDELRQSVQAVFDRWTAALRERLDAIVEATPPSG